MAETGQEKRGHPRVPFVLRVNYPDRARCADATENLSRGGLFIQTELQFEVGQTLPLSLSFPGLMEPIELVGRVAWIRPERDGETGGIGVRVEGELDQRRLSALLDAATARAQVGRFPAEGFHVLIVEDNEHVVGMYKYVLSKLASTELGGKVPMHVHFAADGHVALKLLEGQPVHLVLTDLYMPVMDGFAFVERLRKDEGLRDLPVIAISAGGKDAQQRALDAGVDIYLRKPVRFVDVLQTVKQLLHIR
jgi:uncharacterized protein (TIGR02266 family)